MVRIRSRWNSTLALLAGLALALVAGAASAASGGHSVWVELGTQSGPIPSATRSEPAHLLIWRGQPILIDVGDGATEQLAKAGVPLTGIHTILISHLHFDHTGGLFALLGMRFQGGGPTAGPVTIYGPPGTKALVEALRSAMVSGTALAPLPPPDYRVIELNDGATFSIGDVKVTAAANTHYALWASSGPPPVSLSYRFDLPDRSIVYTGDTGPSAAVERLAHGADLLVSEIMDADTALATLKRQRPDLPAPALDFVRAHFTKEHLLPDQVGLLADHAGVHALVLTHFGGATGKPDQIARLKREIAARFHGSIRFANDLDRF